MDVTRQIFELITSKDFELVAQKGDLYLTRHGKPVESHDVQIGDVVRVVARLRGGKGGFGSMLRAIGAQIEKTTNREACRDLSGRRLRDINDEKRLRAWIDKQAERQQQVEEQKRAKLEKLRRKPKHVFDDKEYMDQSEKQKDDLFDALEAGLGETSSSTNGTDQGASKRKLEEEADTKKQTSRESDACPPTKKKRQLWIDADLPDDSELSDSDESEDASGAVANP